MRLNVVETGPMTGQPIIFIHGLSQSAYAWSGQLDGTPLSAFRTISFDLRGHGESDKPVDPESYTTSDLWADDLQSIILELQLDFPVVVAWSYGGCVVADYLRKYGDAALGGICFVSALTKLGVPDAARFLGDGLVKLVPGLLSSDAATSVQALESFVIACTAKTPDVCQMYEILGYNVSTPPSTRVGVFSRVVDNDEILSSIIKPVLVIHGDADRILLPVASNHISTLVKHAISKSYDLSGHMPFSEQPDRFNADLAYFVDECTSLFG